MRQQGEEWQRLVENLPGVVLRLNASGDLCYVSGSLAPLILDGDIGCTLWSILRSPEDVAIAQHGFQQVQCTGEPQLFRISIKGNDTEASETRHFEIRLAALQESSEHDGSAGVVAFVADITEQRTLAESLEKSERRLRHLMSEAPITIYACESGETHDLTYVGDNVVSLAGFRPEIPAAVTTAWKEHNHPDDTDQFDRSFVELLQLGHGVCEYRFRHADGHYVWIRDECRVDHDSQGHSGQIIGTWHNISWQKQLGEEIVQSQKMEATDRLAGGIAHDFNNILTVIQGNSRFVLEDLPDSHKSREDVEEILGAAQRASALTRQLLSFSRKQIIMPVPTAAEA